MALARTSKAFLTSSGLSTPELMGAFVDHFRATERRGSQKPRVAYVPTAFVGAPDANGGAPKDFTPRARDLLTQFKNAGMDLELEAVDIASLAGTELVNAIGSAECVYVDGGNTFWLLQCVRRSGFGDVVADAMASSKDGFVYVGRSAGSIVAGVSARTAVWKGWDDPSCAPDLNVDPAIAADDPAGLRGMGLVPFSVFPHYAPKWEELYESNAPLLGHPCRAVADDAGLVVGVGGAEGVSTVLEVGDILAAGAAVGAVDVSGGAIPDT